MVYSTNTNTNIYITHRPRAKAVYRWFVIDHLRVRKQKVYHVGGKTKSQTKEIILLKFNQHGSGA